MPTRKSKLYLPNPSTNSQELHHLETEVDQIEDMSSYMKGISKTIDSANSLRTEIGSSSIPIGSIIEYGATNTNPMGYLECNGAAVSRAMYPDLFDVIGTSYGPGDGSTTFNLPKMTHSLSFTDYEKTMITTPGDGTFTPTKSGYYKITLQGGGGGGGGAGTWSSGVHLSGSGGGSGAILSFYEPLTVGTSYSFTVGAGGAGGTAGSNSTSGSMGGVGGTSSITLNSNVYVSNGGFGGYSSSEAAVSTPGAIATINGVKVYRGPCSGSGHVFGTYAIGGNGAGDGGAYSIGMTGELGGGGGGGFIWKDGEYTAGTAGGDGYIIFEFIGPSNRVLIKAFDNQTPESALIDVTQYAQELANKLPTAIFTSTFGNDHNNIFRGQEITDSWATIQSNIQAGNFDNYYIGDYKQITLTTNEVVIMEIAGINCYKGFGSTTVGNHIDFISRDCLATPYQFNATNTNNGQVREGLTYTSPWQGSDLFWKFNSGASSIYSTLPSDVQNVILAKRAMLENRYSGGGVVSSDTGWSDASAGELWLPSEIEVFGHASWSEPGYGTGGSGCNLQYPIFKLNASKIIKGRGNGGTRCEWWELSACKESTTYICYVHITGAAAFDNAFDTTVCVPLCFRIA